MTTNLRQLFLEHVGQTSDNPMMLEVERAEGIYLYGRDGKRWIDLISGVSVSAVGHGNRQVIDAICSQAQDYLHLMVYGEAVESPQVRYAQRIASLLPDPLDTVYFVNSGSEAVEGALKLAKRYTGRTEIIYYKNAYHGSTHGSLSVMGGEEYRNAYRPLLPDTRQIRFNEPADLRYVTPRTACVIIEPVQGEGGIFPADRDYLQALRDRCDQTGTLLIYDEIQTGLGRTGTLYFFQQYGIVPDILCTAKAFGGGMPLGAFIASNRIMSVLKTNPVLGHITTFGGHPVCCAAGLAALEYILSERLTEQADAKGALYESLLAGHPLVREIRRTGLLLGVEFGDSELTARIVLRSIDRGLMTEWFLFHDTAMRIAPPLTITDAEIRESCEILLEVLNGAAE
ncbi:aspartate aminotransferase family protein [Alistipes sp. AF48-12]|uniref:aspartate aminotransferase family protein n=1 Tax=Alistipes sp. AF48-12 TaxID=2291998 RepID=UPI000E557C27|nr:aspartate aminotransferase family protein [Alistipes sp. AF48-12]RHO70799.1 aspartate aminotransferase family protein [Alistipes sp. AF48-12]